MRKSKTEPLRSLPREMSMKYGRDSGFLLGSSSSGATGGPATTSSTSSGSSGGGGGGRLLQACSGGPSNIATTAAAAVGGGSSSSSSKKSLFSSTNNNSNSSASKSLAASTLSSGAVGNTDKPQPYGDSMGVLINSGQLNMIRGIDNRNSGGSSSVATPNSPQQSPLSLCSSGGGGGGGGQEESQQQPHHPQQQQQQMHPHVDDREVASLSYHGSGVGNCEDGLSEEELRQIATRQHRQIQLQHDDICNKQQRIHLLRLEIERNAARMKVSSNILKLKELYERQEQKLKGLRNLKNQALQNKSNYITLKADINNFHIIISSKKSELKRLEKSIEERREYIRQKQISVNSVPPDFEAFIRQKNSYVPNTVPPDPALMLQQYQYYQNQQQQQQPHGSQADVWSSGVSSGSNNTRLFVRQDPSNVVSSSSTPANAASAATISSSSSLYPPQAAPSSAASSSPSMFPLYSNIATVATSTTNNISDVSAFPQKLLLPHSSNSDFRTTHNPASFPTSGPFRQQQQQQQLVPPPLPEHSYQKTASSCGRQQQGRTATTAATSSGPALSSKRPPPPSYSDATLISARYAALLAMVQQGQHRQHHYQQQLYHQQQQQHMHNHQLQTPTSSPPVLRRLSIVGLPSGKVPSRFASRNTINNIYTKKSSLETLEKYRKTASEIYKLQLSQFKSSSSDDVRTAEDKSTSETAISSEEPEEGSASGTTEPDNGSVCSSSSSLSLPDDLAQQLSSAAAAAVAATIPTTVEESVVSDDQQQSPKTAESGTDTAAVASSASVDDSCQEAVTSFIGGDGECGDGCILLTNGGYEWDEEDALLWQESVVRALQALQTEPNKHILKKPPVLTNPNEGSDQNTPVIDKSVRRAFFHPHSLLLDAALEAEFDLVKEMADKVPDISEATDEGITALHNAVCSGREDVVRFLLERGARVNAGDTDGWTPLHCAASCNSLGMAQLLVEFGASLFACSLSDGETPLQKCEPDDEDGANLDCEQYLIAQQDQLGVANEARVFALFEYEPASEDELTLSPNQALTVVDREPDDEPGWVLAETTDTELALRRGLVAKAYLSLHKLTLPGLPSP